LRHDSGTARPRVNFESPHVAATGNAFGSSFQDQLEFKRELLWRRAGVPESDIGLSRKNGMDARDIATLRLESAQGKMFIVRNPKAAARPSRHI
jgi:hypothetical protein